MLTPEELTFLGGRELINWPFAVPRMDTDEILRRAATGLRVMAVRELLVPEAGTENVTLAPELGRVAASLGTPGRIVELRLGGDEAGYSGVVMLFAVVIPESSPAESLSISYTTLGTYTFSIVPEADAWVTLGELVMPLLADGATDSPSGYLVSTDGSGTRTLSLMPGKVGLENGNLVDAPARWTDLLALLNP